MIRWRGYKKVVEECGELLCEIGKVMVVPEGEHWDEKYGKPSLRQRMMDEVGDVFAALDYLVVHEFSSTEQTIIRTRRTAKFKRFSEWELDGIEVNKL